MPPISSNRPVSEYDPVVPASPRAAGRQGGDDEADAGWRTDGSVEALTGDETAPNGTPWTRSDATAAGVDSTSTGNRLLLKRGHAISFAGLFLFTAFVYLRPYELIPALSFLRSGAFFVALLTLLIFIPTQLGLEGNLTARPREVNLVLLLVLAGLLSIPLAISPGEAWEEFTTFFKVAVMFIVMVNVVRSERRWRALLLLILAASCIIGLGAINEYRAGRLSEVGQRIQGIIGGMFENPNDLALHLVTMVPITLALLVSTRGPLRKLIYGACAVLMGMGIMVTFSRGGFIGLACAMLVAAWKIGRRHRLSVVLVSLVVIVLLFAFAPSELTGRLAATTNSTLDPVAWASGEARREVLIRSIVVALYHPLFGVGMGNFHIVSIHEHVSHNAYTQVAAEMGFPATIVYVMFILTSLGRMRRVERETLARITGKTRRADRDLLRYYYLAIGLQASLIGYMVSSFFASVAYLWYIYYLAGFVFCLHRLYEARIGAAETADGPRAARDAVGDGVDHVGLTAFEPEGRALAGAFDGSATDGR